MNFNFNFKDIPARRTRQSVVSQTHVIGITRRNRGLNGAYGWSSPSERGARTLGNMKRVVILGRGASGKSTLATRLGEITGLPVVELDKVFWRAGLVATPRDQWVALQEKLVAEDGWIMDGDLGPYDAVEVRLRAADTIILLDFSLIRCAWQAVRRSRERADFWRWLLSYRFQSRPILLQAVSNHAPSAALLILRDPAALRRFVADIARKSRS
jgi:nicotinamide riboside kinase